MVVDLRTHASPAEKTLQWSDALTRAKRRYSDRGLVLALEWLGHQLQSTMALPTIVSRGIRVRLTGGGIPSTTRTPPLYLEECGDGSWGKTAHCDTHGWKGLPLVDDKTDLLMGVSVRV